MTPEPGGKRYLLLSQDNCPKCEHLKAMLARPMKGKYDARITVLHRQSRPDTFGEIAERYKVQSTPAIVDTLTGEVLLDFGSGPRIAEFLSR